MKAQADNQEGFDALAAAQVAQGVEALRRIREELTKRGPRYARQLQTLAAVADIPTGQTPKEAIWHHRRATLWRYRSNVAARHATPILVVASPVNRPYVLDLHHGGSFVEYLLGRGYDVSLLDWGVPDPADKDLRLDDLVRDYLPVAVEQTLQAAGAAGYTLLGYDMGGTLAAIHAALLTDDERPALRNLVLLAAPIDFADEGPYALWLADEAFDVDAVVASLGNVPAELIDFGGKALKPARNVAAPSSSLWDRLSTEEDLTGWLAINQWANDGVPVPGAAFRQWITAFYQENRLIQGTLSLSGRPVDLGRIDCPLLVVAAARDHLVPAAQAAALLDAVASADRTSIVVPAGHVGLFVGRGAMTRLWPAIAAWLDARTDASHA